MNKKLKLLMTAATVGVIGCVAEEGPTGPEPYCGPRQVTVNHAAAYLSAHPEHISVCAGDSIVINVAPPVDAGLAKTAPAGGKSPPWLNGSNDERDKIVLQVPEKEPEGEHKYSITIDGVGTLDPRVTVAKY